MQNTQSATQQNKSAQAVALLIGGLGLVWILSRWIVSSDSTELVLGVALVGGLVMLFVASNDWRNGIYVFLAWLAFEDLIRKFAGNSTYIFFAKDALIGVTYFAMLKAMRRRGFLKFKPPFAFWLSVFFVVGVLQILNPNSPSPLYGILGLKLYFYYVPLMFAGYALLRTEEDLHKILMLNTWIAVLVAGLGIAQSILGLSFLNPAELDPTLQTLGHDIRYSPITHMEVQRGTSVYVSEGRYAQALVLFFILGFGTAGYLLMRTKRGRKLVFPTFGIVTLATIMAGIRSSFVAFVVSAAVLVAGFAWGTSWRKGRGGVRIAKTVTRAAGIAAAAIVLMILLYPDAIAARWALYTETLTGQHSELSYRGWEYPLNAMKSVFSQPNWVLGNGIGTASLGTQYVSKALGTPPPPFGSESGYGSLVLEFGMVGPILWILWIGSLVLCGWKIVRQLKETHLFPIGFALFWYQVYVLVFGFFYGMTVYQNYLTNAYLWLSVGMLFRLPELLPQRKAPEPARHATASA